MMVDLYNSLTGNSGQMLYLYYAQVIINFTEVAIKQRGKKLHAKLPLAPNLWGKEMASPLDSVQNSEKRTE